MEKKTAVLSTLGALIIGTLFLTAYGVWIEPYRIEVSHVWIQDAYWGKILEKKVLVQLSDLHIGKIGSREQRVLRILDGLRPDFIFLTGDYVKRKGDYKAALSFLARLKARTGIWAVMGDYDYSSPRKSCLFCHDEGSAHPARSHAVRFLKDSVVSVRLPKGPLRIAGIDMKEEQALSRRGKLGDLGKNGPVLVLSHSPLAFDLFSEDQDVLILAGDTHGGQIPLPSWLLSAIGYRKNALYSQGLFVKGNKRMFVNRGIGTSHLPLRLFRRPEITVLHFTP